MTSSAGRRDRDRGRGTPDEVNHRLYRTGRLVVFACVALWGGAANGASAEGPREVRPTGLQGPLGNERLSDGDRLTRHAYATTRAPVHRRPFGTSPIVARLHFFSEDGPEEVYLVVSSRVDVAGRTWLRVRVPQRPFAPTGWVVREALGDLIAVRTKLRVNRRTLRAVLYRNGRRIWSSRIGVGTPATPTPAGRFWIRTRLRLLRRDTIYGPWAFGTSAYAVLSDWPGGDVVGIHGTNRPTLIPGRPSHGCIRVPNPQIERLARLMPVGTPVEIL